MSAFAPLAVAVFGVSTPFAYWGFHMVAQVVEALVGRTLHLHVGGLEQFRDGFARREGGSVVLTSDFPEAALADFVCRSELPLIAFGDDPGDALDWTMKSRDMSPLDAGRLCARVLSAIAPALTSPRALVLSGGPGVSPQRMIAAVVEHLFPGREGLAAQTVGYLARTKKLSLDLPRESGDDRVDEAPASPTRAEMRRALAGYGELGLGRRPREIDWPVALFTRLDERPWSDPIDLMGPARVLMYGPYLHLPAGDWTARVEFEIDGAVSGVEAMADVRIDETVTEKSFTMPAKGIYAYDFRFHVADPHHAVEIRLFTQRSALEGVFLLRSVRVRPQG